MHVKLDIQDQPPGHDPRLGWAAPAERGPSGDHSSSMPVLRHRRDGILPTVAAALSLPSLPQTLTATASRSGRPVPLHPLVRDVLDGLGTEQRERGAGRCPEVILLSRHLTTVETERARAGARRGLGKSEARRALKNARVTTRHIREDGDPRHGQYAPHCRSCTALLTYFGVRSVSPTSESTTALRVSGRRPSRRSSGAGESVSERLLEQALQDAGWRRGRHEGVQAERWADTLSAYLSPAGHPHALFPAAFEAWAEFGGLGLACAGPGERYAPSPVQINPLRGLHWARTLGDLGRALGTELSPLGEEDSGLALLALDREGRVYSLDHTGDWYLGPDVRSGVAALLTGAPLTRLEVAPPD